MLEIASVGWSICNSWVGVMATLAFVIIQGGSPNLLYGLWFVFIMYGFVVYTLAELASVYPSAGGHHLGSNNLGSRIVALSLIAFLAATIISLVRAPTYQSAESVWVTFVDGSGWGNRGVVFFIGILTPGYMYGGLDGAIHLAEEATNAREAVPLALLSTWSLGFVTSFIVAVTAMYSAQDFTTTASRLTWAFARDTGLIFSSKLSLMNDRHQAPV
ncbi:unnamed protein product [Aureobasidium uvarum]|uniref:Uncharacterized protein n=1 Tax=Aureobasidium uvarum TaxID=2773716 RepID=A0A9N8PS24_9PEZI|nr:unnamed protein product [Aureobasidium uvarum]